MLNILTSWAAMFTLEQGHIRDGKNKGGCLRQQANSQEVTAKALLSLVLFLSLFSLSLFLSLSGLLVSSGLPAVSLSLARSLSP